METQLDSGRTLTSGEDDAGGYRAISPLSLVALGLGLFSPLAWTAPFLLLIPAAAIAAALIGLAKIQRSEGRLGGSTACRAAIVLALLSIASAVVRTPIHQQLVRRQVDAVAHRWADLLADKDYEAAWNFMTSGALSSLAPPRNPGEPPLPDDQFRAIVLEKIGEDPVVAALQGSKPPRLRELEAGPVTGEGVAQRMTVRYQLLTGKDDADSGAAKGVDLFFLRAPAFEASGSAWRLERWTFATPGAGAH